MKTVVAIDRTVVSPKRLNLWPSRPRLMRGTLGVLFLAGVVVTIAMCRSMQDGMTMPGGWTMSMTWMRMPGQTWLDSATMFITMWTAMMVAMMLPALTPVLCSVSQSGSRSNSAALAGAGYFLIWIAIGAVIYPVGVGLAGAAMGWAAFSRAVPIGAGAAALLAGLVQLSSWKSCRLRHCRNASSASNPLKPAGAWQLGLRLGIDCVLCCLPFTAIMLVAGVMDPNVMALVTAAITVERLSPRPELAARASGVLMFLVGTFLISRAITP
jgi:predicted metal-binding membrane protein